MLEFKWGLEHGKLEIDTLEIWGRRTNAKEGDEYAKWHRFSTAVEACRVLRGDGHDIEVVTGRNPNLEVSKHEVQES